MLLDGTGPVIDQNWLVDGVDSGPRTDLFRHASVSISISKLFRCRQRHAIGSNKVSIGRIRDTEPECGGVAVYADLGSLAVTVMRRSRLR